MSKFGQRIAIANQIADEEFADIFIYAPMLESINAKPTPDPERAGGEVRLIPLKPGQKIGSGISLHAAHDRSSANIWFWYMARGLLTDVRQFDRFTLAGPHSNPDAPFRFEVADAPIPIGFGRWKCQVVELPLYDEDEPLGSGMARLAREEPKLENPLGIVPWKE